MRLKRSPINGESWNDRRTNGVKWLQFGGAQFLVGLDSPNQPNNHWTIKDIRDRKFSPFNCLVFGCCCFFVAGFGEKGVGRGVVGWRRGWMLKKVELWDSPCTKPTRHSFFDNVVPCRSPYAKLPGFGTWPHFQQLLAFQWRTVAHLQPTGNWGRPKARIILLLASGILWKVSGTPSWQYYIL